MNEQQYCLNRKILPIDYSCNEFRLPSKVLSSSMQKCQFVLNFQRWWQERNCPCSFEFTYDYSNQYPGSLTVYCLSQTLSNSCILLCLMTQGNTIFLSFPIVLFAFLRSMPVKDTYKFDEVNGTYLYIMVATKSM